MQLEIKTIQQNREIGKKEFTEFTAASNKNFHDIQENFAVMQKNFETLFALTKGKNPELPPLIPHSDAQGDIVTTPEQGSVNKPVKPVKPVGTTRLQDPSGHDLHLDGTVRQPYKHPNTAGRSGHDNKTGNVANQVNVEDDELEGDERREQPRFRAFTQPEMRRMTPIVKPARTNIPEFDGEDADSWIQILEQYFDSARTQLDQRTDIAITYLKGPAMQWWIGTGYSPHNVPWHRFCR